MKVDYLRAQVGRATCEACSGNLEVSGTIPAFAVSVKANMSIRLIKSHTIKAWGGSGVIAPLNLNFEFRLR